MTPITATTSSSMIANPAPQAESPSRQMGPRGIGTAESSPPHRFRPMADLLRSNRMLLIWSPVTQTAPATYSSMIANPAPLAESPSPPTGFREMVAGATPPRFRLMADLLLSHRTPLILFRETQTYPWTSLFTSKCCLRHPILRPLHRMMTSWLPPSSGPRRLLTRSVPSGRQRPPMIP